MLSAVTEHYVGNWSSVPVTEIIAHIAVYHNKVVLVSSIYMLHVSVVLTVLIYIYIYVLNSCDLTTCTVQAVVAFM